MGFVVLVLFSLLACEFYKDTISFIREKLQRRETMLFARCLISSRTKGNILVGNFTW